MQTKCTTEVAIYATKRVINVATRRSVGGLRALALFQNGTTGKTFNRFTVERQEVVTLKCERQKDRVNHVPWMGEGWYGMAIPSHPIHIRIQAMPWPYRTRFLPLP